MKDKLEKFIEENRQEFDHLEPSPELWDKVQNRLDEPSLSGTNRKNTLGFYALRAAAVLIFGFLSIFIYEQFFDQEPVAVHDTEIVDDAEVSDIKPEIKDLLEAEVYYNREVDDLVAELDNYSPEYDFVKDDVLYDLAELDSAYVELKAELKGEIYNEEVVASMIENYRLKIMMLEEVLQQLRRTKPEEEEKAYDASL